MCFGVSQIYFCTNDGERKVEYTKALVTSISSNDQRYNPEVSGTPAHDPRVTSIADRLQQARTLLISHSASNDASAEAYMQGDEAGDEGSGSGRNYPDDDAAYDAEGSGEEGSGSQDVGSRTFINEDTVYSSTPKTSAAAMARPLLGFVIAAALATLSRLT